MKEPKNLRIILVPVEQFERFDVEAMENGSFKSTAQILNSLFHKRLKRIYGSNTDFEPQILTVSEFRKMCVFTKAYKAFCGAMLNIRKRKQCYNLSEFMDEFNNQEFGEKTDQYWFGYVKLK